MWQSFDRSSPSTGANGRGAALERAVGATGVILLACLVSILAGCAAKSTPASSPSPPPPASRQPAAGPAAKPAPPGKERQSPSSDPGGPAEGQDAASATPAKEKERASAASGKTAPAETSAVGTAVKAPAGKETGTPDSEKGSKQATGQDAASDPRGQESGNASSPGLSAGEAMPVSAAGTLQEGAAGGAQDPAAGQTGSGEPARAQTPEEQQAGLEKQLEGSLKKFDKMLLREQEGLAEKREDPSAGGGFGAGGGGTGDVSAGTGEAGSDAATADPGAGTGAANESAPAGGGAVESSRGATAPAGIPDGSDDDIVARQLREAAASEKDPVLQKKLWKEYCQYKKSTGGKQCRDTQLPAAEARAEDTADGKS